MFWGFSFQDFEEQPTNRANTFDSLSNSKFEDFVSILVSSYCCNVLWILQ